MSDQNDPHDLFRIVDIKNDPIRPDSQPPESLSSALSLKPTRTARAWVGGKSAYRLPDSVLSINRDRRYVLLKVSVRHYPIQRGHRLLNRSLVNLFPG